MLTKSKKMSVFLTILSLAMTGCGSSNGSKSSEYILLKSSEDKQVTYKIRNEHEEDVSYDSEVLVTSRNAPYFTDVRNLNVFNNNVASFGMTLCAETYPWEKISITDSMGNVQLGKDLYTELGIINKKQYALENDDNDIAGVTAGNFLFLHKEEKYQVFTITFRGTVEDKEWLSNLDMGTSESTYLNENNPCSEWKNKNNHKGFDVSVNRLVPHIDSYLNEYKDNTAKQVLFITGHSRGAALANIYGAMIANIEIPHVTYTFACPATYVPTDETTYSNIFNVINEEDVVSQIPTKEMGFIRYGVDKTFKVSEHLDKFEIVSSTMTYKHSSSLDSMLATVNSLLPNREAAYTIPEEYDEDAYDWEDSLQEVQDRIVESKIEAKQKGFDRYIVFDEPAQAENGKYRITWRYSKAIIFSMVSDFLNVGSEGFTGILLVLYTYIHYCPALANQLLSQLVNFSDVISDTDTVKMPHYIESYMVYSIM